MSQPWPSIPIFLFLSLFGLRLSPFSSLLLLPYGVDDARDLISSPSTHPGSCDVLSPLYYFFLSLLLFIIVVRLHVLGLLEWTRFHLTLKKRGRGEVCVWVRNGRRDVLGILVKDCP